MVLKGCVNEVGIGGGAEVIARCHPPVLQSFGGVSVGHCSDIAIGKGAGVGGLKTAFFCFLTAYSISMLSGGALYGLSVPGQEVYAVRAPRSGNRVWRSPELPGRQGFRHSGSTLPCARTTMAGFSFDGSKNRESKYRQEPNIEGSCRYTVSSNPTFLAPMERVTRTWRRCMPT